MQEVHPLPGENAHLSGVIGIVPWAGKLGALERDRRVAQQLGTTVISLGAAREADRERDRVRPRFIFEGIEQDAAQAGWIDDVPTAIDAEYVATDAREVYLVR